MSRTHIIDPCAADDPCLVPPAEFVRLRYFFGQRLGVLDLADEQSYLVGKQRLHNLRLHGAGVLCGLRAERYLSSQGPPAPTTTTMLRVRRGAAIDWCGREVVVGWDQCIDVAAWYAQHPEAHTPDSSTLRLWVALCYLECPSDPAPAPRDPCGCDAGGCEFARIREGFELKLITDAEAKLLAEKQPSPDVAALVAAEVLSGPLESAYARVAALLAGTDCPGPPADACLLLAHFQAKLDASGQKVIDITPPDNTIPERRSLLPTSLLQLGLLHAVAAATEAGLIGAGPHFSVVTFKNGGANSGTLSIDLLTDGSDLSRNPFDTPAQLKVSVFRFKDNGTWEAAPTFTPKYVPGPPSRIEVQWTTGLAEARYRVLIETNRAQPPVDKKMRPLVPPSWARHFRLVTGTTGTLVLAESLYPASQ